MKDFIVITSCTSRKGLADLYERQLMNAGIDYCFETIPVATSSFTMASRLLYWRELATRFIDYRTIIVTDAWDVLFFGTKQELLDKVEWVTYPIISAERNCFPGTEFGYDDLTDKILGTTPWKYCNPGMMVTNPERLLEWIEQAERYLNLNISDQAWFNIRRSERSNLVVIDATTNIFYVISYNDGRLEDGSLQVKDGRLWNNKCDTYPNFFHFAGHGPMEVQRVLSGHDTPRYEAMRLIRSYIEK